MSTYFCGRGNLADVPELKTVEINGEEREVAQMRIYFDRLVPKGDDDFDDKGDFWLNVNLWGPLAENAARILQKGARVYVDGRLERHEWQDCETGSERVKLILQAHYIALDLSRVKSATLSSQTDHTVGTDEDRDPL
jgi:single-strand DNA-binding protein